MNTRGEEILKDLSKYITERGGAASIATEVHSPNPLLTLTGRLDDVGISVRYTSDGGMVVVRWFKSPPQPYTLSHETAITRFFGSVGLVREARIGVKEFDDKYIITNIKEDAARALFTSPACEAIYKLEPFIMFSGDTTHYELVKHETQFDKFDSSKIVGSIGLIAATHDVMRMSKAKN
jgi:hypothetical protein